MKKLFLTLLSFNIWVNGESQAMMEHHDSQTQNSRKDENQKEIASLQPDLLYVQTIHDTYAINPLWSFALLGVSSVIAEKTLRYLENMVFPPAPQKELLHKSPLKSFLHNESVQTLVNLLSVGAMFYGVSHCNSWNDQLSTYEYGPLTPMWAITAGALSTLTLMEILKKCRQCQPACQNALQTFSSIKLEEALKVSQALPTSTLQGPLTSVWDNPSSDISIHPYTPRLGTPHKTSKVSHSSPELIGENLD